MKREYRKIDLVDWTICKMINILEPKYKYYVLYTYQGRIIYEIWLIDKPTDEDAKSIIKDLISKGKIKL